MPFNAFASKAGQIIMHPISHVKGAILIRANWLLPFAALAGFGAAVELSGAAQARSRHIVSQQAADAAVIPGIGAEEAQKMFPSEPGSQPAPMPNASAVTAPRPMQMASGNLGGGFIEMLATGGNAGVRYNEPPAVRRVSYANPAPLRREIDPMFLRQEVDYQGSEAPGTLVVDTPSKFLYFVTGNGRAIRYGIGVGRPGFEWSGVKTISRKAEWPSWTPPAEMLLRRPDLPTFMEGGPGNPLGARAMYLGSSLYRIHGTNEPWSIGTNVSSGCIRMMNDDVVDLYGRVHVGSKVIVM